jgi:hypothetical protein
VLHEGGAVLDVLTVAAVDEQSSTVIDRIARRSGLDRQTRGQEVTDGRGAQSGGLAERRA